MTNSMTSSACSVILAQIVALPTTGLLGRLAIPPKTLRLLAQFVGIMAMLPLLCGCGGDAAGPFGAPAESRILAPAAGRWDFDFEKTLQAQQAAGATEKQIEALRKLYAGNPQLQKMHPDITVTGNEAVCSGMPSGAYTFFAMHEHDGKMCGKAWHHEDRYDPGDMSKCYVRLKLEGDCLVFELRMQEVMDLHDPDLSPNLPADAVSVAGCDADHPAGKDWSEWSTYVFVRRK
jgi:hypothetical protein